ncbi:MAG: hypothetical protein FWB85_09610 [Chitinispirillia bacterium]|nr:hypothetical protein [Chitinispirillia bacterium]
MRLVPAAAVAALFFTGCVASVSKSNTIKAIDAAPKVSATVTFADLAVSEKKVMGTANGIIGDVTKEGLEQEAVYQALQQHGADVMVGSNFFYVVANDEMTVTIVGYPANYKNFRPGKSGRPAAPTTLPTTQTITE